MASLIAAVLTWFRKQLTIDKAEVKSFAEHLDDLRTMLFKTLAALFVGFNVCLIFANRLLFLLEQPLYWVVGKPDRFLQSLNVTDSFVIAMKMAFYGGLIVTMPVLVYFIAQFVLPALKPREKKLLLPVCFFGALLFLAGAALCFFWVVPQTLKAFIKYSEWMNIEPRWTVSSYIEFVTQFMLAMGLTFEVPLVVLVLVQLGVVSAATVRKGRKVCIAVAVIISAIVAPPDPLSMVLMAIPLIALFEVTIWVAWLMDRRKRPQLSP